MYSSPFIKSELWTVCFISDTWLWRRAWWVHFFRQACTVFSVAVCCCQLLVVTDDRSWSSRCSINWTLPSWWTWHFVGFVAVRVWFWHPSPECLPCSGKEVMGATAWLTSGLGQENSAQGVLCEAAVCFPLRKTSLQEPLKCVLCALHRSYFLSRETNHRLPGSG